MEHTLMSDLEFDVLDELYFIKSFDELLEATSLDEVVLVRTLLDLKQKDWIKPASIQDGHDIEDHFDVEHDPRKYHFLATKKGLLAHNGR
jgi:hypothetical protein